MRYLKISMVALAGFVLAVGIAGNGWTQPSLGDQQVYPGSAGVSLAGGDSSSLSVLPVTGGHGKNYRRGYWGWSFGPGWYGGSGYPYGYNSGSYLDTPTRTCVWNGYEYKCYTFDPEL